MSADNLEQQKLSFLIDEFRIGVLALHSLYLNLPEGAAIADDLNAIIARLNTSIRMYGTEVIQASETRETRMH